MVENENGPTLAAAFEQFEKAQGAVERAYARDWTLQEAIAVADVMHAHDDMGARTWAQALWPAIEAAHERKTWKRPALMSRAEFKRYVAGDPDRPLLDRPDFDVFDIAEQSAMLAVATDTFNATVYRQALPSEPQAVVQERRDAAAAEFEVMREALFEARKEGRVLSGADAMLFDPPAFGNDARRSEQSLSRFPGETDEQRAAEMERKAAAIRAYAEAQTLAESAVSEINGAAGSETFGPYEWAVAAGRVMREILRLTSPAYPHDRLASWLPLVSAYNADKRASDRELERVWQAREREHARFREERAQVRAQVERERMGAQAWVAAAVAR